MQNGKPARRKNPGKMGKKMENGSRTEMAEKWPPKWTNGHENGILGSIFPFRWPFFGHFGPGAIFHFLSHFPGTFASGRFPIPRIWPLRSQKNSLFFFFFYFNFAGIPCFFEQFSDFFASFLGCTQRG